jgi:hypothetical protein
MPGATKRKRAGTPVWPDNPLHFVDPDTGFDHRASVEVAAGVRPVISRRADGQVTHSFVDTAAPGIDQRHELHPDGQDCDHCVTIGWLEGEEVEGPVEELPSGIVTCERCGATLPPRYRHADHLYIVVADAVAIEDNAHGGTRITDTRSGAVVHDC